MRARIARFFNKYIYSSAQTPEASQGLLPTHQVTSETKTPPREQNASGLRPVDSMQRMHDEGLDNTIQSTSRDTSPETTRTNDSSFVRFHTGSNGYTSLPTSEQKQNHDAGIVRFHCDYKSTPVKASVFTLAFLCAVPTAIFAFAGLSSFTENNAMSPEKSYEENYANFCQLLRIVQVGSGVCFLGSGIINTLLNYGSFQKVPSKVKEKCARSSTKTLTFSLLAAAGGGAAAGRIGYESIRPLEIAGLAETIGAFNGIVFFATRFIGVCNFIELIIRYREEGTSRNQKILMFLAAIPAIAAYPIFGDKFNSAFFSTDTLKAMHPALRALIGVGGISSSLTYFSQAMRLPETLRKTRIERKEQRMAATSTCQVIRIYAGPSISTASNLFGSVSMIAMPASAIKKPSSILADFILPNTPWAYILEALTYLGALCVNENGTLETFHNKQEVLNNNAQPQLSQVLIDPAIQDPRTIELQSPQPSSTSTKAQQETKNDDPRLMPRGSSPVGRRASPIDMDPQSPLRKLNVFRSIALDKHGEVDPHTQYTALTDASPSSNLPPLPPAGSVKIPAGYAPRKT